MSPRLREIALPAAIGITQPRACLFYPPCKALSTHPIKPCCLSSPINGSAAVVLECHKFRLSDGPRDLRGLHAHVAAANTC